jgi:tRNA A37 N6-isopentenylltransferase MiaA
MSDLYFDAIISNISRTSRWRSKQAEKYPSDRRNARAAEELQTLAAASFTDIDPAAWGKLAPYLQSETFMVAVNDATKDISFRAFPKNVTELIEEIAGRAKAFGLPVLIGGGP